MVAWSDIARMDLRVCRATSLVPDPEYLPISLETSHRTRVVLACGTVQCIPDLAHQGIDSSGVCKRRQTEHDHAIATKRKGNGFANALL